MWTKEYTCAHVCKCVGLLLEGSRETGNIGTLLGNLGQGWPGDRMGRLNYYVFIGAFSHVCHVNLFQSFK